jgi:nascent polypeptide-associated complex subunit alpha
MFPGVNPRQMKQMMRRMGIRMEEISAERVVIHCLDRDIIVEDPQVLKTIVQGQDMFQISGSIREEESAVDVKIEEEDIELVSKQAGVTKEEAKGALEKSGGDIAEAILALKG